MLEVLQVLDEWQATSFRVLVSISGSFCVDIVNVNMKMSTEIYYFVKEEIKRIFIQRTHFCDFTVRKCMYDLPGSTQRTELLLLKIHTQVS
jgi:hypothetical protein